MESTTGLERLRIGAEVPLQLLRTLAFPLTPPFFVLYVLHTSRCGNQLGRYQSPELSMHEVDAFTTEFSEFLSNDGRHDLWLRSPQSDATLVWDRHDLIFAYGPLAQFRAMLKECLVESAVDGPPDPHAHNYHAEYDASEQKIVRYFQWFYSPLLNSDEQLKGVRSSPFLESSAKSFWVRTSFCASSPIRLSAYA